MAKRTRRPTRYESTLKQQLQEAMAINRSAAEALVASRADRDRARSERDITGAENFDLHRQVGSLKEANDHLAGVNLAEAERHQKHQRKLFRIIFDLNLRLSNRAGYIERVRENDPSARYTSEPAADATIDEIRERLAGAESENQRDRIIESVGIQTLNEVLGAPDDPFVRP